MNVFLKTDRKTLKMETYTRTVKATQMKEDFVVPQTDKKTTIVGRKGDYLVLNDKGEYYVFPKGRFETHYRPTSFIDDLIKEVKELEDKISSIRDKAKPVMDWLLDGLDKNRNIALPSTIKNITELQKELEES